MRTVIEVFWHIVIALTGAIGFGALVAGGAALLCGGALAGGSWLLRARRARRPDSSRRTRRD